jgi:bifunctional non-homologous end joining protein LigD
MSASPQRVSVQVDGRTLALSNLEKVLYPAAGFTKGQVLDYYARIAPNLLPHLRDRPLTFKRYPDGVDGHFFFEKNAPSHTPDWVRRVTLPTPGSTKGRPRTDFAVICDLPTLIWAANLATLELHVPMWRVDRSGTACPPDLMVYDLDPGPPATIVECCEVAELIRRQLEGDDLVAYPKTSGSKGLQLYVPVRPDRPWQDVHGYARRVAERLQQERPDLVVANMKKTLRASKVLVDWSQNNAAKTTVAVYSLRARPEPTVSTPVGWPEVARCRELGDPEVLRFEAADVLARVDSHGDLFAPLLRPERSIPDPT